ncbi:MAG: helix-turn-helix transcriptional regulator [Eubacterium sp.]|nr:helix-turn-helix transcriptional regulator [Eubacterium sp.]
MDYETLNQRIGARLKEARLRGGYSVEQTAGLFDCSPENYRRIEKGIHVLTPDKFVLLREYMNIDPLYLLTGETREDGIATMEHSIDEDQFRLIRELFSYCRSFVAAG